MSATVMAPVEAPMANTPSSLPDAVDQVRLVVSPVVDTVTTAPAGGSRLGQVGRRVGHGRRDVGDRDGDRLGVGGRAVCGLDHEVVARRRLPVEVGRVGHGDGAGGGADGEHAVVVARGDATR